MARDSNKHGHKARNVAGAQSSLVTSAADKKKIANNFISAAMNAENPERLDYIINSLGLESGEYILKFMTRTMQQKKVSPDYKLIKEQVHQHVVSMTCIALIRINNFNLF